MKKPLRARSASKREKSQPYGRNPKVSMLGSAQKQI